MVYFTFGHLELLVNTACTINEKLDLHILKEVVVYIVHYKINVNLGNSHEFLGKINLVKLIKQCPALFFIS